MLCHFSPAQAIVGCACAVILSACDARQPESSPDPLRVDAATAASVMRVPIFQDDVEIEAAAQGAVSPGEPFDRDHPAYDDVLDQLIDQKLLAQEALRRGLSDDPAAQRRLQTARERILGNLLVENLVASDVNEARILEMYEEQVSLQQLDDEVRLSRIITETEGAAFDALKALSEGETFAAVARTASIDATTRLEGGAMGYLRPNSLEPPYPRIIADTAIGSVSEPFETTSGWAIIRVEDRRTEAPQTLEEMRPEIVTFLTYSQISEILRSLRAEALIDRQSDTAPEGVPERATSPMDAAQETPE